MSEVAESMTDNEALVQLLNEVRSIEERMRHEYDDIYGDNEVEITDSTPHTRAEDPTAIRTVVTNLGPDVIYIKEAGQIVAAKDLNETWVSPSCGKGEITVYVNPEKTATIAITTYTITPEDE